MAHDRSSRAEPPADPRANSWEARYEAGLKQLLAGAPSHQWADVASVASTGLDAAGALDKAIAELDFALSSCDDNPDAVAFIATEKVPLLVVMEEFDAAERAMLTAERSVARGVEGRTIVRVSAYRTLFGMLMLAPDLEDEAIGAVGRLRDVGLQPTSRLLVSWLVPYMASQGHIDRVRPIVRSLSAAAALDAHPWRADDAKAFESAIQVAHGAEGGVPDLGSGNWLAHARVRVLELWSSLQRRPDEDVDEREAILAAIAEGLPSNFSSYVDALSALVSVSETGMPRKTPEFPVPSLVNLAAILASCEADAVGPDEPATRAQWAESHLLPRARTSLEWPTSTDRVIALLMLRAGEFGRARELMESAISFASVAGYPIESALARLQLAEIIAQTDKLSRIENWETLRSEAWVDLQRRGVPPAPHAYRVSQVLAWRRSRSVGEILTPRESQVLDLLARWLTYRAIADELGIGSRTVQTHAIAIYAKLGVHSRLDALRLLDRIAPSEGRQ
jgi:DNA-binding CsgD family transcriptional regulator